ncbi:NADH-quinone oxidoreductase subunit N [Cellulosimicrobium sp. CUA-896]|uniref:NADH-quinone oxidoreductase subunit N n=1 Tax=Cellulosimicrobium sp. CUA-896 TaxID=1517881 RepID=UPI00095D74F9|nr:proton-conducting transporter membrane subunit [Cellulosimicrobium sp. CUA-896]OLT49511.1 NADH-quinone oxidoreductase subunit N [Cellulosimicrobium sp. CUA-896]
MSGAPAEDPLALLPEAALLAGAVAGLLLGLWTPQSRQRRVAVVVVAACLLSAALAAPGLTDAARTVFSGTWSVDAAAGTVRVVAPLATALAVVLLRAGVAGDARETETYVLATFVALGADVLAASDDALMLVAGFLLASVPAYALAGTRRDARGTEAALKYYLLSALAGVVLLVGVVALVLATGTTSWAAVGETITTAPRAVVALAAVGIAGALLFTAGAVPVHFWVPDLAAGTPPAVAALLTTVAKLGALVALWRLVTGPFAEVPGAAGTAVAVVAAASMTLGNLAALPQTEPRRLLGYSTISQVGYLLMPVAVAGTTALAEPALLVYLAAYAVTNVGAFAAVAAVPQAGTLQEWARGAAARPWVVVSLLVCLLGLVGTPPTAVFVGKVAVFAAAADGGAPWLAVVAVVNTLVSLAYYLRWIAPAVAATWRRPPRTAPDAAPDAGPGVAAGVLHACAAVSLVLGVAAGAAVAA